MSVEQSFSTLLERVRTRQPLTRVVGLRGVGAAHALLRLAECRPVVTVARSAVAAEDLVRDLRFVAGAERAPRILVLPADERTPYHATSPDPLIVMERVATLYKLACATPFDVLVMSPRAFARRGLPLAALQDMAILLSEGDEIERSALIAKLTLGGYSQVNSVEDPGTFAVRGGIIDVFWPGLPLPVRIDLFGDEVESLKLFDPSTQRTREQLDELSIGPAREIHLTDDAVERGRRRLRELADEVEFPTKKLRELLTDLEARIPFFGIESMLPAFHERLELPVELLTQALGRDGFTLALEEPDGLPA
ncbi:MAG: transcription-repair coupling factor, partial [Myxococcota bacterium]